MKITTILLDNVTELSNHYSKDIRMGGRGVSSDQTYLTSSRILRYSQKEGKVVCSELRFRPDEWSLRPPILIWTIIHLVNW